MDLNRLSGIDALLFHEPARLVGPHRDEDDVKTAPFGSGLAVSKALLRVDKVLAVTGVCTEVPPSSGPKYRPAAPPRLAAVAQTAC